MSIGQVGLTRLLAYPGAATQWWPCLDSPPEWPSPLPAAQDLASAHERSLAGACCHERSLAGARWTIPSLVTARSAPRRCSLDGHLAGARWTTPSPVTARSAPRRCSLNGHLAGARWMGPSLVLAGPRSQMRPRTLACGGNKSGLGEGELSPRVLCAWEDRSSNK